MQEIARLADTVAGILHKELARLADAGLLLKDTVGNQVPYEANRDCPIFEELASIFRKPSGITDVLASALASHMYLTTYVLQTIIRHELERSVL